MAKGATIKKILLTLLIILMLAGLFWFGVTIGKRQQGGQKELEDGPGGSSGTAGIGSAALDQAGEEARRLLGEEAGPIFAIQVGSFMVKADCETVLADLQARGYPAYVLQIKDGERLLHRIHVGPYPTFSAAEDAAKQFILEEEIDAIPIRARSGPVGPAKPVEDDTQIAEG